MRTSKRRITMNEAKGEKEIKKYRKFLSVIISALILNILAIANSIQAVNINSANITSGGDCGELLTYQGMIVKVYYAQYTKDGISYPAYCLDKTKKGVDNKLSYSVSVENAISDVKLWRIIINGYPYKTIEQLGCKNKEEAFSATKQAIYCYIHGNNPADYGAIGEAGQRTLNALHQILNQGNNSTETQISNTINIVKEQDNFKVDEKESQYVSKTYSIKANGAISNYKVELQSTETELPEGIKITTLDNIQKQEFSQNEKFKILIPIKNLTKEDCFNILINTQINSKPVLYGKAANPTYQDYALTAATYEDASGNTQDKYYKNETKVKIVKQDQETQERLENVEFNIYDSNKQIIYSNLKTNKNGEFEISNFLPGKYYIQETNAKDGYILNDQLIEFNISFNEELTLTINNLFKDIPENKKEEKEIEKTVEQMEIEEKVPTKTVSETVVRKLPVTGM